MKEPSEPVLARIEALVAPYRADESVRAVIWAGSALRPWADGHSDLDLRVIVDDDRLAATDPRDRFIHGIDRGPPRRKTHEIILFGWSQLKSHAESRQDILRHSYRFVRMVHDRDGETTTLVRRIGELDEQTRLDRVRVHYHEAAWHRWKADLTLRRGNDTNAALHLNLSLLAQVRLVFVIAGSWVPALAWADQELEALGVSPSMRELLRAAIREPKPEPLDRLLDAIETWMAELEMPWAQARPALHMWAFVNEEGRRLVETWSTGLG